MTAATGADWRSIGLSTTLSPRRDPGPVPQPATYDGGVSREPALRDDSGSDVRETWPDGECRRASH